MIIHGMGARAAVLVALASLAPAWRSTEQDAEQKLKDIHQRLEQEQKDWKEIYQEAKTDAQREALLAEYPGPEFIPEFRALALESKGTDVGADAWITIHGIAGRARDAASQKEAVEHLVADHLASSRLAQFAMQLGRGQPDAGSLAALRTIAERATNREVKAGATSSLATLLAKDPAKTAEARATFATLRDTYGDVKAANGGTYAEAATASLFELDHLQVGMTVPDFEAKDQAGSGFRLSDYKGKVVMVDFWGFW